MSGPTKGMVAGQPIRTGELSKEYEQGFDATFGERKRVRGRFRWDPERKEMVSLDEDWTDTERKALTPTEELTYGGAKATDGTPINSRKKLREYLRSTGTAHASDFSREFVEKVKQDKERSDQKEGRERIAEAVHKHLR